MPREEARTRYQRGFTLLETLVGIALTGVLAGIGTVRLVAVVQGIRVAGAAHTVATALRLARGRALAAGRRVDVQFDVPRGALELRADVTLETRVLPGGVVLAGLPARGRFSFNGLGTTENGTVTLAASTSVRRVIVNQRGRVRLQ